MPFDRTTEVIAHFIGIFHVDAEAARMRDGYDAFRAGREDAAAQEKLPNITITLRAPYELEGFDPGVKYQTVNHPAQGAPVMALVPATLDNLPALPSGFFSELAGERPDVIRGSASVAPPQWDIPPPNSILTVTVQNLWLSDDDFLDFGHGYAFVDPAVYASELMELADIAQALSLGMSGIMEPGYIPTAGEVLEVIAGALALDGPAIEGAEVTVLSGEAATGIVVNGVQVDEMPGVRDHLPAALRDEEDEDGAEGGEAEGEGPEGSGPPPAEVDDNPFAVAPGHHVTTGGNLAANEAYISMSWVDAEVIGVMGDVVRLDIISQVNVLSAHDSGGQSGAPSVTMNAAQIELVSSDPDAAEAGPSTMPVLPSSWQVERIEGDVVALNWVQQYVFATDFDQAEIEFSGSATAIGLGGNTLGNITSLVELGFHYDLIIVGGSMIALNMIEQINVLLDSDAIAGMTGAANAISGGDNLLYNGATISTTGIDTVIDMTDTFRADGEALAAGSGTISQQLATDPLFQGEDALSALYISGDLIRLNSIQQHNYIGDADQVYLALQEFVAGVGADVTVTTGSNALVNDAHIRDVGLDSIVLAAGEVYTDALIYQAGLIDTDAMPSGVTGALTNEAVAAFLASDMIDPAVVADDAAGALPLAPDSGSLDVMQSVLA